MTDYNMIKFRNGFQEMLEKYRIDYPECNIVSAYLANKDKTIEELREIVDKNFIVYKKNMQDLADSLPVNQYKN